MRRTGFRERNETPQPDQTKKNDVGLFIFGLGLYIEWLVAVSIINAPFLQLNCLTFD